MNKIKALIERGWNISLRAYKTDTVFWYGVEAYHNFYGDIEVNKETLVSALDEMGKQVRKLELID